MREVPKEQNKHFNFSEQETVLMFGKLKRHEKLDFIKGLIRMGLIRIHVNNFRAQRIHAPYLRQHRKYKDRVQNGIGNVV